MGNGVFSPERGQWIQARWVLVEHCGLRMVRKEHGECYQGKTGCGIQAAVCGHSKLSEQVSGGQRNHRFAGEKVGLEGEVVQQALHWVPGSHLYGVDSQMRDSEC